MTTIVQSKVLHLSWCERTHENTETHSLGIASDLLPEIRRVEGHVTRPAQGYSWSVWLEGDCRPSDGPAPDSVVVLSIYTPDHCLDVRMLSGEARNLLAALARAADRELFG